MYNRKRIENEKRMLEGNFNRMCITDDREELENLYNCAIERIAIIYAVNEERLKTDN